MLYITLPVTLYVAIDMYTLYILYPIRVRDNYADIVMYDSINRLLIDSLLSIYIYIYIILYCPTLLIY